MEDGKGKMEDVLRIPVFTCFLRCWNVVKLKCCKVGMV